MKAVRLSDYLPGTIVDVSRNTILGNPFWMADEGKRAAVCAAYREWLWRMHLSGFTGDPVAIAREVGKKHNVSLARSWAGLKTSPDLFNSRLCRSLARLCADDQQELLLGCHCAPKECHADVIIRYVKWRRSGQTI